MTDGDVALVIEALYQMAADPDQWRQVIDSMADQPPRELAPGLAERSLRHTETVARLAAACESSFAPEPAMETGWVLIDSRRRVADINDAGRVALAGWRIEGAPGTRLTFGAPANEDAFRQALATVRQGSTSTSLIRCQASA